MDRNMIEYLPPVLRDYREFKVILTDAQEPEISNLWEAVDAVFNNQFIEDVDETGVSRWEKMLSISPRATESLDERKFRILTRINRVEPYTITNLHTLLASLCGADGYFIEVDNAAYTITVRVVLEAKSSYDAVMDMLKSIIPANLILDLSLKYNSHRTLSRFTHRQLAQFTHRMLRNEVL